MISVRKLLRVSLFTIALTAVMAVGASAATLGAGTVTADALRLRETPSAEGTILATAPSGANLVVLEESGSGWCKVNYNAVEGYMSSEWLTVSAMADVDLGRGKVNDDVTSLNVRTGAGTDCAVATSVSGGTVLELTGIQDGWYKVKTGATAGYVSSDYITITTEPVAAPAPAASELGQQIVDYAKGFLGTPYVYGANGPNSFDCSGFTKYVYGQFGHTLNRTATDQLQNGTSVSKDQLVPGDLVFFKYRTSKPVSHVGIYIGNGQFIHASTNSYAVQIDDLSSGHYANVYVYGRHVI